MRWWIFALAAVVIVAVGCSSGPRPAHSSAPQTTWQCTCNLLDDATKKDKGDWGPKTVCTRTKDGAYEEINKICEKDTKERKVNCKCQCKHTNDKCDW
jgi:hypothetical protein